jgi:hypothetical protein
MVQIDKAEVDRGTEFEVGGPDVTASGHGRLVLRKSNDRYEIRDLDNGRRVDSDASLRGLLRRSGQYTAMDVDHLG